MTYSIIARDPRTGDLGIAVQSHFFAVGRHVPWAEPGVGAIVTQAALDARYGVHGLGHLRAGRSAHEALRICISVDDESSSRQVAIIDASGAVAVHTGSECIPHAMHATDAGVSAQANMAGGPSVAAAMVDAYRASGRPFPDRLLFTAWWRDIWLASGGGRDSNPRAA